MKTGMRIIKRIKLKFRGISKKYTKKDIMVDLKRIGIKKGDSLFIHSSLSKIGFVEGGANTLIDALKESVGEKGTLIMPAFTIHIGMKNTLESEFIFDPIKSETTVGKVPETFRRMSGVHRSLHPTHSVCAFGNLAKWITEGHEQCSTTFGPGTPLYKIMEADVIILGIGIDLAPVTFYHVIEEVEKDFPVNVHCENEIETKLIDHSGKVITMKVLAHNTIASKTRLNQESNRWNRIFLREYLINKKIMTEDMLGMTNSWLIKAKDLYQAQLDLLDKGITIYTTEEEYNKLKEKEDH